VGAGPGDTDLITVKGLRCLREADVVVYDYHVNVELLNEARLDAELVYAGKRGGHHTMTQDEINAALVDRARKGFVVCRLKGGDPFIFGRGGEEAEVLEKHGIPFEVVPGISSAISAPAYAGIPLTHRRFATTVAFIPGHEDRAKAETAIPWDRVVGISTLVFLMGVKNLPYITERLIEHGRAPSTPVAVIRWGTRSAHQTTLTSTLGRVAADVKERDIRPPAIMVVGEVVRLRDTLKWFEKKPLFGHRILVTREDRRGIESLKSAGAELFRFPTIEITDPEDWTPVDRALERLGDYDWLVLTSRNGVERFFRRLRDRGGDVRDLAGVKICAIGSATARAVAGQGLRVDVIPETFRAEGLVSALGDVAGTRILLPRAEEAREVFPDAVRARGGSIDVVVCYRSVPPHTRAKRLRRFLKSGKITIAMFTSGKTFKNFLAIAGDEGREALGTMAIAALGPVTARAIEDEGYSPAIVPEEATMEALEEAILRWALHRKEHV